jgi:hypothetical protein
MVTKRKLSAIGGMMSNKLAIGVIAASAMTVQSAFARPPWEQGGGAPAPEIGAGVLGTILAVGAVKFFRRNRA